MDDHRNNGFTTTLRLLKLHARTARIPSVLVGRVVVLENYRCRRNFVGARVGDAPTDLKRSSQLLEEIEHFCWWRQEKVAKIVPYGLPPFSYMLHASSLLCSVR
jgi:hypothetical protein